jgi:hypothetical protein
MAGKPEPAGMCVSVAVTDYHIGFAPQFPQGRKDGRRFPEGQKTGHVGEGQFSHRRVLLYHRCAVQVPQHHPCHTPVPSRENGHIDARHQVHSAAQRDRQHPGGHGSLKSHCLLRRNIPAMGHARYLHGFLATIPYIGPASPRLGCTRGDRE